MPSPDEGTDSDLRNPFASSDPVTEPSRFYGRRSDIQRVFARIGSTRPQSISIISEKAMGKTSLINTLAHPDTKEKLLSEPDCYLFGHIRLRERGNWEPESFFRALTDALRETHPDLPSASKYDEFRALIQHLDSENLSLVAFFDDFEVITQSPVFPLTFFSFLRSMANTYNVGYVTSSSESLQRLCVSKDVEESPFFNIFTNIFLKPLDENAVRQWVIEGSSPSGVSLSSEADWVYAQVGGFPELVRTLSALIWERKYDQGKLSSDDLAEIETEFQKRDLLEVIWDGLKQREQSLCAHLLTSDELDRPQMHFARELTRRGYLRQDDEGYALFGSAFGRFVAEKTGVEIKSDNNKKRRWWRLGR